MTETQSPDGGLPSAVDAVDYPDAEAGHAARLRLQDRAVPTGSLGSLEPLATWIASVQGHCPPTPFERARVVLIAADHGIAEAGVSAYASGGTAAQVALVQSGQAPISAVAGSLPVRVVDVAVTGDSELSDPGLKIRTGSGRIDREDALSATEVQRAIEVGIRLTDEEIAAGADLLILSNLGVAASTPSACLVSILTDTEPIKVVGRGSGIDDAAWIRKCAAVRDARRRGWPSRNNGERLLARVGGVDLAVLTGMLVQAAARRVPVLMDGLVASAAGLTAQLLAPRAINWFCAAQLTREPAHQLALRRLALTPVLALDMQLDQGVGGVLALPVLRAAAALVRDTASLAESGLQPAG